MNGRQLIARLLRRVFVSLVLLAFVSYAADFAWLHFRLATHLNVLATVTVHPYYAVPQKNHKVEFLFEEPHDETCVEALFPHLGDSPCWYLDRNKDKRIDM